MVSASMPRFRLVELTGGDPLAAFARDVAAGLTAEPKHLSCCYFYDREGSRLFAAICERPEYYLTRAETEILQRHASEGCCHGGRPARSVLLAGCGWPVQPAPLRDPDRFGGTVCIDSLI
jgi:uncharacterized SAM-dependent methyltransferase